MTLRSISPGAISIGVVVYLIGFPLVALEASRDPGSASPASVSPGPGQQGQGRGRGSGNEKAQLRKGKDDWKDVEWNRRFVLSYYEREGLPPGLAKRESLPPGLAKQLRERGQLPPGLEKKLVRLPIRLERDLPPLPPYCERRILGDMLLVIDFRLNVVVGLIPGVLPRR